MREPLKFILHHDGSYDPTLVRFINSAPQAAYEIGQRRQTEALLLQSADQLSPDTNDTASSQHWLAASAVARSQYARSQALATYPLQRDQNDSRRFVRLLNREQKRYDLPSLPGSPYDGAKVADGLRCVVALFVPDSLNSFDPIPSSYVARVVTETAQFAVAFHDEVFLELAQERFFCLGVGRRTRAKLAEYLHPYKTGGNFVPPTQRLSTILDAEDPALYVRQSCNERLPQRRVKPIALDGLAVLGLDGLPQIVANVRNLIEAEKGPKIDTGTALLALGFDMREMNFMKNVNVDGLTALEAGASMGLDRRGTERIRQSCYRKSRRLRKIADDNALPAMGNPEVGFVRTSSNGRILWQPSRV